jgi:hypothetical protein
MFGNNKTYHVSYRASSGLDYHEEMDRQQLRDFVNAERNGAVPVRLKDGGTALNYDMKIINITTDYLSGRDKEFFSPGISVADKYSSDVSGYFIKDTRSNFKALAPGTDAILIFSTRDEAKIYYMNHKSEIENDYMNQRDSSFDLNDVIYESITNPPVGRFALNLTGRADVFPSDDIYNRNDILNMSRMVGSYEDYCARNEYAQNLKYIRPIFSEFVKSNAKIVGDDRIYLNLDEFDSGFKSTFDSFVKNYPEMVNQDVAIAELKDKELMNNVNYDMDISKDLSDSLEV